MLKCTCGSEGVRLEFLVYPLRMLANRDSMRVLLNFCCNIVHALAC